MDIVKRSGATEAYDGSKIVAAIAGAFSDVNREASEETLAALLRAAEESIAATDARTVEAIQDIVERSLMEQGYFDEAKAYILYRHRRAELRTVRADIVATAVASCDILSCGREPSDASFLDACLACIQEDFPDEPYALSALSAKFKSFIKPTCRLTSALESLNARRRGAYDPRSSEMGIHRRTHSVVFFPTQLAINCADRGIETFYDKIRWLTDQDLYGAYILEHYTRAEIEQAWVHRARARRAVHLFGSRPALKRDVITTRRHVSIESPQEMFLGIALHLATEEKTDRMGWMRVLRHAFQARSDHGHAHDD